MPDARSRELAGVQVGDVLHHFVKGINVVALYGQRGLAGVELHLKGGHHDKVWSSKTMLTTPKPVGLVRLADLLPSSP